MQKSQLGIYICIISINFFNLNVSFVFMQRYFKLISISYKTAPLHLRERVTLSESKVKDLLNRCKEIFNIQEIIVLSTCNRTEIYYLAKKNFSIELIKILLLIQGISFYTFSKKSFLIINYHDEAIYHFFRVSIGLESKIVGDIQITNQIKKAYQWTVDMGCAGPFLHRLLHTIFFTNKRVVQETNFRDGAASVSYAAFELIQQISKSFKNLNILVMGIGEIGTDLVKNMRHITDWKVTIINRTEEKAFKLAKELRFQTVPFKDYSTALNKANIIISSINQEKQPFFSKEKLSRLSSVSCIHFIDLAVPRSIATDFSKPNLIVYNINDLYIRSKSAIEKRISSIPQVESIIDESISNFEEWRKKMIFLPTIQKFKHTLESIRQQEIAKYLKNPDSQELKKMEKITKSIMQKIIQLPIIQLKAACQRGNGKILIDGLNDLFNLEKVQMQK